MSLTTCKITLIDLKFYKMKIFIKHLFAVVIILGLSQNVVIAQDAEPQRYISLDYMKVEPEMHEEYLKLEQIWKKIHKVNIEAGKYERWTLTKVEYPKGTNEEYNYITRINFLGEEQLANYIDHWEMPDLQQILTSDEIDFVDQTREIRTFVKSEVWSVNHVVLSDNMDNVNVNVFNFFDFPEGSGRYAFNKNEKDIWLPLHEARINDGKMKAWVILNKQLPYGSAQEYHAATVDVYESTEQYLTGGSHRPYFEKLFPNKSVKEIWDESRKAADLVRSELRRKIDHVGK